MTLRSVRAGIIGGLVAGIVLDLFLVGTGMLTTHASAPTLLIGIWQFVAEWAVGKLALTSTNYAWLGGVVHFLISIAWGIAFAYVARQRPQVTQQPVIAGVVYGVVVWIGTQLVLMTSGLFKSPSPNEAETELIAYCIFFGIPLAYTVSRTI